MVTLIRKNFKLICDNKYLLLSYIALFISINIYLFRLLEFVNTVFFIEHLKQTQKLSKYIFIYFCFVSYEFLLSKNSTDDFNQYTNQCKLYETLIRIAILILMSIIVSSIVFIYNYIPYASFGINYIGYLKHILNNVVLNIQLVSCAGILLGAAFAQRAKRFPSYTFFASIAVIIVFNENIISFLGIALSPAYTSIIPILDIFNIFPPNLTYAFDSLYGLAIESIRWNIVLFWLNLLSFIILLKYSIRKNALQKLILMLIFTLCLLNLTAYISSHNDSYIVKDTRKNGIIYGDYNYWSTSNSILPEKADFVVLGYKICFDIERKLKANVIITYTPKKNDNIYKFTLYRGYKIISIEDEQGQNLDYIREGDYLKIYSISENNSKFIIKYDGNGKRFYSNKQGILLLGYFPYYPISGHCQLWDTDYNETVINKDFTVKDFDITVNSKLNIATNIPKVGNNHFCGKSETVSIVGGFVQESTGGNFHYTYSPVGRIINDSDLINAEMLLQTRKEKLKTEKDISFETRKLIFIPITIVGSAGSANERTVVFQDHILTSNLDIGGVVNDLLLDDISRHRSNSYL